MEINWYGHSCFRLRSRGGVVVTDPYGKEMGYTLPRLRADIVTISHPHPGHNYLKGVRGTPKLIDGPGEYEIQGVFITGIASYHDRRKGRDRGKNTIYLFDFEGLTVCHLGDLGQVPTQSQVEDLSDIDILLVPVGSHTTINAAEASEVISLLEPRVVIPMHYRTEAMGGSPLDSVDRFLKVMGVKGTPQESLNVTKGTLPDDMEVVVLESRG